MPITNTMDEEPSFLQASNPETAHREQQQSDRKPQQQSDSKSSKHSHAQHRRLHNRHLHGRQVDTLISVVESIVPQAVTEVVQTISVIQQIAVDEQGNTIGITTYTNSPGPVLTSANSVVEPSMASSAISAIVSSLPVVIPDVVQIATLSAIPTTSSDLLPTKITSSTPDLPTTTDLPPLPSSEVPIELPVLLTSQQTFASLIPSINATVLAGSFSQTTFISSTTSAASSSTRSVTSTTSISSTTASTISSDSLLETGSPTNSFTWNAKFGTISGSIDSTAMSSALAYTSDFNASPSATSTGGLVAGGAIGAPGTPLSSDSGSATGSANNSDKAAAPLTPPKMAGVVVGSLAGFAIILILALYILKHIKKKQGAIRLSLSSNPPGIAGASAAGAPMAERQSRFLPVYSAFRSKPKELGGGASEATDSSEPSFVRISGRKLPSVLHHGGDGYGDPNAPPIPQHVRDASFYADDTGYHGGTGMSSAVAGGALAATTAASSRNLTPTPQSQQNQPRTPTRDHDLVNPFSSPSDPADEMASVYGSPMPPIRQVAAQRGTIVTNVNRSKSQNIQLSSNVASSPPQATTSPFTATSQGYDGLDRMVLRRPDPLGRSHPSQDGSKGSRFREDV